MHKTVPEILDEMKATYIERSKTYGANYLAVGNGIKSLFPNGVTLTTANDFMIWHLFELMFVKITRFCFSELKHKDSIHDAAVYCAMIEEVMGLIEEDERTE